MREIIKILALTIIGEILAAPLLIVLGGLLSRKVRWVLTATLGRILNVDVEYVFRNKREADEDIREEIDRAGFVYLLTGRGNELQRETFAKALAAKDEFKILLPATTEPEGLTDWTAQREAEIAAIDPAFGRGILRNQIETTASYLQPYILRGAVELKRYNYPHIGRILITDRAAYFTPYRKAAHGRDSNIIKYRRGEMYDSLFRLFDQLWTNGNS